MTAIIDFEYDRVSELVAKYLVYDKEKTIHNTWKYFKISSLCV